MFDDPLFRESMEKVGQPAQTLRFGDRATCTEYAMAMIELANRYRQQLSAQR